MDVDPEEFKMILERAISGSHRDLERILQLYEPLINKYAFHDGCLDEDLRQYICLRIAIKISKFKI